MKRTFAELFFADRIQALNGVVWMILCGSYVAISLVTSVLATCRSVAKKRALLAAHVYALFLSIPAIPVLQARIKMQQFSGESLLIFAVVYLAWQLLFLRIKYKVSEHIYLSLPVSALMAWAVMSFMNARYYDEIARAIIAFFK